MCLFHLYIVELSIAAKQYKQHSMRKHKMSKIWNIWFKQVTVIMHFVKNKEKEVIKKRDKNFAPYYSRDLIMTEVELCEWIQSIQVFYNS